MSVQSVDIWTPTVPKSATMIAKLIDKEGQAGEVVVNYKVGSPADAARLAESLPKSLRFDRVSVVIPQRGYSASYDGFAGSAVTGPNGGTGATSAPRAGSPGTPSRGTRIGGGFMRGANVLGGVTLLYDLWQGLTTDDPCSLWYVYCDHDPRAVA